MGCAGRSVLRPEDDDRKCARAPDLPHWIFTDDMLGTALSGLETAQILSSGFGFGRVCLVTGNTEPVRLRNCVPAAFP